MTSGTAGLILKVLDCLDTRAIVTAHNIANGGTRAYRPLKVSFEQALVEAAHKGPRAVEAVRPDIRVEDSGKGHGELRLDLELATASSTALRYGALIDMLNRQMQIDALALSRGS
jgi:flagellar basal-body rod protein FlgB